MWKLLVEWLRLKLGLEHFEPGECECTHNRCSHVKGRGLCCADVVDEEGESGPCACQQYIPWVEREDSEDARLEPMTMTPQELERLYNREN